MGIRETLNEKPAITTAATIGIIVIIGGLIWWSSGGSGPGSAASTSQFFFSDDDGKTYFADDAAKIPPFDHNGKQAVRAVVFSCKGVKKVEYLQRYTAEAKKKLEQLRASKNPSDFTMADTVVLNGTEVKKPGDKDWVSQASPKAIAIQKPSDCPGEAPEVVSP